MEVQTAQLRVMPKVIVAEGCGRARLQCSCGRAKCSCGGAVFYATASRARALIAAGAVELLNAPAEQKPVGPGSTKPAGPSEKKTSVSIDGRDGRSTGSVSSIEPGTAAASSSSGEAPALPLTNAQPLAKRARVRAQKSA